MEAELLLQAVTACLLGVVGWIGARVVNRLERVDHRLTIMETSFKIKCEK